MLRYISRRILVTFLLLIAVSAVVFTIFNVFPSGDVATLRAGRNASPQQVAQVRASLGLDDSVLTQFARYLTQVFTPFSWFGADRYNGGTGPFNFGVSVFQSGTPVKEIILQRLPVTAYLVAGAVVLWMAIAVPVGVISAVRRRTLLDRATMVTSLAFISAPVFWLGLVALYAFGSDVGAIPLLPGIGAYNDATSFWGHLTALLLPWGVLAAGSAAIYARYLRSQMIEVMEQDYVRTARAKGLPERRVVMKHALRSAITPIVTLLGLDIGLLLAGNAILTESVFNLPGIGGELVTAINRSDVVVIQGIVLFGAFFIIAFNLLVDIAYAYLDPRVRY